MYRQAHTPTAVEFSVYCNFISSKEKNLVVAGTSQLFVYRIIHDVEVPFGMGDVKDVAFYPLDDDVPISDVFQSTSKTDKSSGMFR